MKYINLTGKQNAQLLLEHSHFPGRFIDVGTAEPGLVRPLNKVA